MITLIILTLVFTTLSKAFEASVDFLNYVPTIKVGAEGRSWILTLRFIKSLSSRVGHFWFFLFNARASCWRRRMPTSVSSAARRWTPWSGSVSRSSRPSLSFSSSGSTMTLSGSRPSSSTTTLSSHENWVSGVIYSCVRKTVELVPFFAYKYVQARHLTSNPNPFEEGGGGGWKVHPLKNILDPPLIP